MTRSKRLRFLREAYAALPPVACKGLCWQACAAVPVYPLELEQVAAAAGREPETMDSDLPDGARIMALPSLACPVLAMKRCTVYEARPLVCRAFGAVAGMPCPHGCGPTERMSDQAFDAIRARVAKL